MNSTSWSAALLLAALSMAPSTREATDLVPVATAKFAFEVQSADKPSLMEFLEQYQRVAGVHLFVPLRMQMELDARGTGLTQSVDVPREKANEVVEGVLAAAGYGMTVVHAGDPCVIGIRRAPRTPLETGALFVAPDELGSVANHPAFTCWTVLDLPLVTADGVDPALVRPWIAPGTSSYVRLGGSGLALIAGNGKIVAERARALLELEEAERVKRGTAVKPAGGSTR